MRSTVQSFLCLLAGGWLVFLTAAPPSIGVIRSNGDFQVDGSTVRGNATVFQGSTIQTAAAESTIQLSSGAEIALAPGSRAEVYLDHTVLRQGSQSIQNGQKLSIEAATLRISPTGTDTLVEIKVKDGHHVSVVARQGSVNVRSAPVC